jgi:peptide deformylase
MMDILQIGHPQLRHLAQPITNFADDSLQTMIDQALIQLIQAGGVGIAAPQVGDGRSWCIVASHPSLRYPDAPYMAPLVMLNPRIVDRSETEDCGWEGCLSVPGLRGLISRSTSVQVAYHNRDGQSRTETFEGFVARIVQHECDHLQGVIFLDRVETMTDLLSEAEYRRTVLQISEDLPT